MNHLSAIQAEALNHTRVAAKSLHDAAQETISTILDHAHLDRVLFDRAVKHIESHAQVALHFHPDRPGKTGQLVVEALLKEGVYRSQFETKISNGGLTAFQGGQPVRLPAARAVS